MLKGAKILFGDAVIDCLVLDVSASGVRISTDIIMALPQELTIEFRSGGTWRAAIRWQRGTETGLELQRFTGLHPAAAAEAFRLLQRLAASGVQDIVDDMDAAKHFDHPDLRVVAANFRTALAALEETLRLSATRG